MRYVFGSGYWLSPNHHVLPVNPTHIAAVCAAPENFGISLDQLSRLFAKHGEPWCSEGEARRIVIIALVQEGKWVRIRHYRRGWTINLPDLSPNSIARIRGFFHAFGEDGVPDHDVLLDHPKGQVSCTVSSLVAEHVKTFHMELHELIRPTPVLGPADIPVEGVPSMDLDDTI